jgi:glycosyltransferase 2 family protein
LSPQRERDIVDRRPAMVVGLALGLPVSGLFLWLAIRGSDLGQVRSALGDATIAPLVLAAAFFVVVYAAQAERWRRIAAVRAVGWRTFAELVVSSVACNNVLPARIGDLLRARWLGRRAGLPAGRALATVVLDRACDLVVLFALLLATLPEVAGSGWSYRIAIGTLVLLVAVAVLLVFARAYTRRRARARLASRNLVRRIVRDVVEGLAEPMGRRRLATAIALSAVAWLAFAGAAIAVGRSVDIHFSVIDACFVTAVINLGVAIPSSPGFVGTYQWLGVASLGLVDVDRSRALAFAILLQAIWFVPTTLVGGGLLASRGVRRMTASDSLRRSGSESAS